MLQLAAAFGLLILPVIYLVRLARGPVVFQDVVLVVSLMWPVALAFYRPLLGLRNPIWVVLGGLALLWLLKWQKPVIPHLWPLVIFFVYMMVTSLWAVNSIDSATRTVGSFLMMVYVIIQAWTRPSEQAISRIFDVLMLVSLGILFLLVWIVSQKGISLSQRFQMPEAGLKATGIANFALTAFIMLGGLGFKERGVKRLAVWTLAVGTLVLMVFTQTRATLFALMLVIGFIVVFEKGSQGYIIKLITFLLILVFLTFFIFQPDTTRQDLNSFIGYFRLSEEVESIQLTGSSWSGRGELWRFALEKARDRPFLGRGTGSSSFAAIPDWILASLSSVESLPANTVHNQFVETYYDHGLIGLALLSGILVWITRAAFKIFRAPPPGLEIKSKTLVMLWLTVPIGMLSHGGYFSSGNPQRMWVWITGIALVYIHQEVQSKAASIERNESELTLWPHRKWITMPLYKQHYGRQ